MNQESEILIYQSPDGNTKVDVKLEDETVWLSLKIPNSSRGGDPLRAD